MTRHLFISLFLFSALSFEGCKKEVPDNKHLYVGSWYSYNESNIKTGELKIDSNGKAYYHDNDDAEIGGPIYFTCYGFKIKNGTNPLGFLKFSVNLQPTPQSGGQGYFMVINGNNFYRK